MSRPGVLTAHLVGRLAAFAVWLASLLGCGGGSPSPIAAMPTPTPEPPPSPFRARLDAALMLDGKDHSQINAVAKVARDAAAAGDAVMAREALTHKVLKDVDKDWVVEECALALARAGKISEGVKLLDLMKDTKGRQDTLERIANGEFASRR